MPLTVITLSKVPRSLRGDLSRWMQEIATGVYVGNFNTKVREKLWSRIVENIGSGEAIMSYAYRNEIGYSFVTHNTDSKVIDYDGIPLVMFPKTESEKDDSSKKGFSNAKKMMDTRRFNSISGKHGSDKGEGTAGSGSVKVKPYVAVDIETDGLDWNFHHIIEIAAVKLEEGNIQKFSSLIKYEGKLPDQITQLTGIDVKMLDSDGQELKQVLSEFINFIGDLDLVGYNVSFDVGFINKALEKQNMTLMQNKLFDLLGYVKKEKMHLDNYKLETVLKAYGIDYNVVHRALPDADLIYLLSCKVNRFLLTRE